MLENFRTGLHCSTPEARNIARGIQSRADFIDHASVVNLGADFRIQLVLLDDVQLVIELARNHIRLARIIVEMLLLAGHFKMAATREIAVDYFFLDNPLDAIDGLERR